MNINHLQNVKNQAMALVLASKTVAELAEYRVRYFGRKGFINDLFKQLSRLPDDQKKRLGQELNSLKNEIQLALANQVRVLKQQPAAAGVNFDPTIPGISPPLGQQHPVTQAIEEVARIFENIGFIRVRYPEITTDWYCFEGVNVPPDHPSRDDQETFFLTDGSVLSTHTTSGILQEVERGKKARPAGRQVPIRMLNIAKCYRRQIDVSHTPMFHQFEGWLIAERVNVGHLKWVLNYFARMYFGPERKTRLRPHHFQYTEPSFEVDVTCGACLGQTRLPTGPDCRFCKDGWTELGGAGMAHPQVLKNAGLDPQFYSGLAFGWGVERILAVRTGLNDIRLLYQNDLRFLESF